MRPLINDATTALLRAVRLKLGGFSHLAFDEIVSRSWASVTFTGARHELVLRLSGEDASAAADAFLADLDVAEFRLRGHILADVALVSRDESADAEGAPFIRIRLEALTVEDD